MIQPRLFDLALIPWQLPGWLHWWSWEPLTEELLDEVETVDLLTPGWFKALSGA